MQRCNGVCSRDEEIQLLPAAVSCERVRVFVVFKDVYRRTPGRGYLLHEPSRVLVSPPLVVRFGDSTSDSALATRFVDSTECTSMNLGNLSWSFEMLLVVCRCWWSTCKSCPSPAHPHNGHTALPERHSTLDQLVIGTDAAAALLHG